MSQPDDIIRIGAVAPPPDEDLIVTLQDLLTQAKSGDLGGIAYVGYATDHNVVYGFVGREMRGQLHRTYSLLHWLANKAMQMWEMRQQ